MKYFYVIIVFFICFNLKSQINVDSTKTEEIEDYSQYENVESSNSDNNSKIYCSHTNNCSFFDSVASLRVPSAHSI